MAAQIALAEAAGSIHISRVVVMGIGEPLANYDNLLRFIRILNRGFDIGMRRITVSTCGIVPMIERLADEALEINLAVSLHSPDQAVRERIMPVARRYPLDQLLKTCKNYFNKTGRRVTFEYALMAGVNDRDEDAEALIRLFSGENVHLNLIRLNPIADGPFAGSQNVTAFAKKLKTSGINCTIRRRIGKHIDAACGQLRHRQARTVPMVTKPRGER
jgi:23S rRNA (adenine2503-C2)-methyltransferase